MLRKRNFTIRIRTGQWAIQWATFNYFALLQFTPSWTGFLSNLLFYIVIFELSWMCLDSIMAVVHSANIDSKISPRSNSGAFSFVYTKTLRKAKAPRSVLFVLFLLDLQLFFISLRRITSRIRIPSSLIQGSTHIHQSQHSME